MDANGVLAAIFDPTTNALRVSSGSGSGITQAAADARYQPIDSDLTAIAALATTAFGRSLLAAADAAALRTLAATDATYQPLDSDLTAIAALGTTSYGRSLLAVADAPAASNLTKTTRQVMSDAGATYTTTTAKTTLLAGTKPVITANTLAVGDTFRFIYAGNIETVGGAATTMKFDLDLINPTPTTVNLGSYTPAQIAITTFPAWTIESNWRVNAIGASGSIQATTIFSTWTATREFAIASGAATIDTTVAQTVDFTSTCASMVANNTMTCVQAVGYYTPKFT